MPADLKGRLLALRIWANAPEKGMVSFPLASTTDASARSERWVRRGLAGHRSRTQMGYYEYPDSLSRMHVRAERQTPR